MFQGIEISKDAFIARINRTRQARFIVDTFYSRALNESRLMLRFNDGSVEPFTGLRINPSAARKG